MVAVAVAVGTSVGVMTAGDSVVAITVEGAFAIAITGAVSTVVTANIVMPDGVRADGVDGMGSVEARVAAVVSVIVADGGVTMAIAASVAGASGVDVRITLAARTMVGRGGEVLCTAETVR